MDIMKPGKINSHNEWDKLKEIIVGRAEGTTATMTWKKQRYKYSKIFPREPIRSASDNKILLWF